MWSNQDGLFEKNRAGSLESWFLVLTWLLASDLGQLTSLDLNFLKSSVSLADL